jgi:hypothetical protein
VRAGALPFGAPDRGARRLAFAFAGGKPTRPAGKPLSDITGHLAWMTSQGIDRQVCGGCVDMFGYELPPAEGEAWSRINRPHIQNRIDPETFRALAKAYHDTITTRR